jgi:glycosyltransferase involved in cell wall biosynthesis
MADCAFVIPGDINLPTGGYAYDRRVLGLLPVLGVPAVHVALPGSYPAPTQSDIAATAAILTALPQETVLLIDGLAYGAMPGELVRGIRQRIVALCHHPLALEAGTPVDRQAVLRQSETEALAVARHVIVSSPTTARILSAEFGVASARITVAEPGTERAHRASGTGRPLSLLAVGSIIPRKGYDVLVTALAQLGHFDWQLSIAGSDRLSPETTGDLHRRICDLKLGTRVRVLGAMSEVELATLYDRADVFVMSSLFEGYGMVLAEAMARGLPIVCTTGGAAAETVPEGAALKVPAGEAQPLAEALAWIMEDAPLRRRMADASWQQGQRLPTWADTARTVAEVIRRVAE